jgi:hypothetical protein
MTPDKRTTPDGTGADAKATDQAPTGYAEAVPRAICSTCGGELFELSDGTDACPTCGVHPNVARILAELLDDVERFISRFVTFGSEHQSAAVMLWVAHVYTIAAAIAAAYLRVTSAVEESGKTTLLELLQALLGRRAINAVSVTPAAVFRTRDKLGHA